MIEKNLSSKIYEVLVNRKFRQGPRPDKRKNKIIEQIANRTENNPIEFLLGWGGYKNPNLKTDKVDLAEKATLEQLNRLNRAVKKVYFPGINVHIVLSGARAEKVNRMPHKKTLAYQHSIKELLDFCGYSFIDIIPVSELYNKYSKDFELKLVEVKKRLAHILPHEPNFKTLASHAKGNVFFGKTDVSKHDRMCRDAAIDYIVFKVAEDEARIYRDYTQSVKAAFGYPAMSHIKYVRSELVPPRDSHLSFYTGSKGNVTQPWQAIGVEEDGKTLFLSPKRLKKYQSR